MGLNLALEASNNSQIVFSLREWEKKIKREEGKKGPTSTSPAGNCPKLQGGGGGGAFASCFGCGALPVDLPWAGSAPLPYFTGCSGRA